MRTTLALKDTLMRSVYDKAAKEHRAIKDVVDELISLGLNRASGTVPRWTCPTHDLGGASFDYTRAWELVDALEADAVAEKMDLFK